MNATAEFLRAQVRTVPDWPLPGVQFRDITPLLADAKTFRVLMDVFVERYVGTPLDRIAAIDARGFILGAVLAHELNLGFAPVRKQGKLPFETLSEDYALEYGSATVEVHRDACHPGERVVLIDDLVATGGTMLAAARLLQRLGARVVECAAIIDLPDLQGSARLRQEGLSLFHICSFAGE